jgi:hypothetical protein
MRNGGGDHFHAGQDRVEGRWENVAAADDGRSDHDDAVLHLLAAHLSTENGTRADRLDRPAWAVIADRQALSEIGRNRTVPDHDAAGLEDRSFVKGDRRRLQRK